MSPIKLIVLAGVGVLMAGLLPAQTAPSPADKQPSPGESAGRRVADSPAPPPGSGPGNGLGNRVAELERHVVLLETRCTALQRKLDKVLDLQSKIHSIEELHAKAEEEIESLHTAIRTRPLNATELKEISNLLNRRLRSSETKMSQMMRDQNELLQVLPTGSPPRSTEDETPYGP